MEQNKQTRCKGWIARMLQFKPLFQFLHFSS